MDTKKYLTEHYGTNYNENERLISQHGSVEFLTTRHYIERYLKPDNRIIEIGAGTGRYSHALARQGYTVDAVELVEHNIEVFLQNTQPGEKISIKQGNAMDLCGFSDNTYDITLLLGPLYHLYTKEDKQKAISEALRVTKSSGVVFAAYCISDGTILTEGFIRKSISLRDLMDKGFIDPETFATSSEPVLLFELVRKEHIDELMADFPVTRLHYVATDGYTHHMIETVDAMDDSEFELYLQYHFATCERLDMVGLSHHVIDVFRKD